METQTIIILVGAVIVSYLLLSYCVYKLIKRNKKINRNEKDS